MPYVFTVFLSKDDDDDDAFQSRGGREGVVLPYIGYIGMCRCEGYGFQAVYSVIGYMNTVNPLLSPHSQLSPSL